MLNTVKRKGLEKIKLIPTFADSTDGGVEDGSITFEICRRLVDEWIVVNDAEIVEALREL